MCKLTVDNVVFLNVRKQILSLIYLECRYLVLMYHLLETFKSFFISFCKDHNIKQGSNLLASYHTKTNFDILNIKYVYNI